MSTNVNKIITGSGVTNYNIKYTANINIYVSNTLDHKTLKDHLFSENKKYYTYTLKEEKTHAFVIRDLDSQPSVDEVLNELTEKGIKTGKVYRMTNTKRPLCLVITRTEHSLKQLQTDKTLLLCTKCLWEKKQKQSS